MSRSLPLEMTVHMCPGVWPGVMRVVMPGSSVTPSSWTSSTRSSTVRRLAALRRPPLPSSTKYAQSAAPMCTVALVNVMSPSTASHPMWSGCRCDTMIVSIWSGSTPRLRKLSSIFPPLNMSLWTSPTPASSNARWSPLRTRNAPTGIVRAPCESRRC